MVSAKQCSTIARCIVSAAHNRHARIISFLCKSITKITGSNLACFKSLLVFYSIVSIFLGFLFFTLKYSVKLPKFIDWNFTWRRILRNDVIHINRTSGTFAPYRSLITFRCVFFSHNFYDFFHDFFSVRGEWKRAKKLYSIFWYRNFY